MEMKNDIDESIRNTRRCELAKLSGKKHNGLLRKFAKSSIIETRMMCASGKRPIKKLKNRNPVFAANLHVS